MKVLEDDHQRLRVAQHLERLTKLPEHPVAIRARHPLPETRRPYLVEKRGHLQEPGRCPTLERRQHVATRILAAQPAEQVEDWEIGLGASGELRALPERHACPGAGARLLDEVLEERRLADASLASDEDYLTSAAISPNEGTAEDA